MKLDYNPLRQLYPTTPCDPEPMWALCTITVYNYTFLPFRRPLQWQPPGYTLPRRALSRIVYCATCGRTVGRIEVAGQPFTAVPGICSICFDEGTPIWSCAQYTRVPDSLLGGYVCNLEDPFLLLAPAEFLDRELSLINDWSAVAWLRGSPGNPISESKLLDTHSMVA